MTEPRRPRPSTKSPSGPKQYRDAKTGVDIGGGSPQRNPDPDTLEGPGGRNEAKGEADARNKTTRRGER